VVGARRGSKNLQITRIRCCAAHQGACALTVRCACSRKKDGGEARRRFAQAVSQEAGRQSHLLKQHKGHLAVTRRFMAASSLATAPARPPGPIR
jgi:hypothetical protein